MTEHKTDGNPLASRESLSEALKQITGQDFTHEDLTGLLRVVTGWNERTCKRYASEALPLDERRRDILADLITQHRAHLEAFEQWLKSL